MTEKLLRILQVTPSYLPATRYGGPIYSVHNLCVALAKLGHDIHVFTTNIDGDRDSDVSLDKPVVIDGVRVWYFPSKLFRRVYYSPAMMSALKSRLKNFDVVHGHSVFLWPTWAASRAACAADIPYVLSPRGMLVKELVRRKSRWVKTAWLKIIEKRNVEKASRLHVTSSEEALALDDFNYRLPPVFTIPNGVNASEDVTRDEVSDDVACVIDGGPFVLYFGRINWKKGLDRLIHAWSDVPEWRLVIAGNDEEQYLSELVTLTRESDVDERIHFIPRSILGSDKEALMQSASLLVLPSYSENFGNVVLESMIRGVPVVVTDEVGVKSIVIEARGGIVVPAENLGVSINKLLEDAESRATMGKQGKDWVSENLTWDKVAREMVTAYREILGSEHIHNA